MSNSVQESLLKKTRKRLVKAVEGCRSANSIVRYTCDSIVLLMCDLFCIGCHFNGCDLIIHDLQSEEFTSDDPPLCPKFQVLKGAHQMLLPNEAKILNGAKR